MLTNAKWISHQPRPYRTDGPAPYLRKAFSLDGEPASACLTYCALGYGVCRINGREVTDDVLTTPLSFYDRSVYYNTYDVTSLLHRGKNIIGFILGNGIFNDANDHWGMSHATWRDLPKVIAKLTVTLSDGTQKEIVTDTSFKTATGPLTYNNARCGEDYDARLEKDGWELPDYDDSGWQPAALKPGPGGALKPNIIPPIRRIRKILPTKLSDTVYDLGENISGWVSFKVKGRAGDSVHIVYAERLKPDGTLDNENENDLIRELGRVHSDNYILRGGELEEWEPMFTYHGFRYFSVITNAEYIEPVGVLVHTDLQRVGSFECSNEILNELHAATLKSTLTCYHSIPEDCPQREQNGWTGDALISAEQSIMNFDMNCAYRQWISDLRSSQRPSGQLPCICPHPGNGWYGSWDGGPSWDGALILIPYYLYMYTGDKTLIEENFDGFTAYLDYLESVSENHIVRVGLGDWNPPSRKRIDHRITNTCYYHTLALTVGHCAKILGYDPAPYYGLADEIRRDYREKLMLTNVPGMDTQTAIACGLYHGMYDDSEREMAAERLVQLIEANGYHIDCGCLGTKAMFTVLTETGHIDVLYKMILNPTAPSYAYWIAEGMDTLCERWFMDASRNHHYFSEIDFWFYKYLAGINITPSELVIKPCFIDDIKWVRASHRGISIYYDEKELVITVPREAKLILCGKEIVIFAGTHRFAR